MVTVLSAWAISCLLLLLLRLHACGHLAGTTDWMLYPYCCCIMPTLLQDIICLGVVTYAGATGWVLPVLLLCYAHIAAGCIACPGALLGQCCCCSYPVLIRQPKVFDFSILVWALLLGLPAEWCQ